MIKTFRDAITSDLYVYGTCRKLPPEILGRARRKLEYLDLAVDVADLKTPPGNRLHKLGGDQKGFYSISINDQWRICFRFLKGDVYDVEITDYH
jgi:proteic killer suppression protein